MERLDPQQIKAIIQAALPQAEVRVEDLTGTRDHYQATVVDAGFAGKTLLARHRMVLAPLREQLRDQIHALTIHAFTPAERPHGV